MKLLVTGAASFVGAELRRQCALRGIDVFGIDTAAEAGDGTLKADIRDPGLAALMPEGIDAAIHLAAVARDTDCRDDPVLCFDVNVTGTVNVFRAAHAKGIKQLIFASSEWIYGGLASVPAKREDDAIDPFALASEYALSKLAGEAALKQCHQRAGMAVTVLRFGIIYGPRRGNWSAVESLLARVADGGVVEVGSGRTARGFVYVTDVARAILAAVGRSGFETYNIQADRPITLREVVETSASILGRRCELVETDPGNPSVRNISSALARDRLGWHPETSLEDGLDEVARFLGLLPAEARAADRRRSS